MPEDTPLLAAARALDEQIQHFADAAARLSEQQLRSKKHLERAGRLLQEIADSEDKIGECLRALNQRLGEVHGVHLQHAGKVQTDAVRVQTATREYEQLMVRFASLGKSASELNTMVSDDSPDKTDLVAIDEKVSAVLSDAETIWEDARAQDFMDVATDADSMRQQLNAVRNKLRKLMA